MQIGNVPFARAGEKQFLSGVEIMIEAEVGIVPVRVERTSLVVVYISSSPRPANARCVQTVAHGEVVRQRHF